MSSASTWGHSSAAKWPPYTRNKHTIEPVYRLLKWESHLCVFFPEDQVTRGFNPRSRRRYELHREIWETEGFMDVILGLLCERYGWRRMVLLSMSETYHHLPGLMLLKPRGRCRWIVETSLSTNTASLLAGLSEVELGCVCPASLQISLRSWRDEYNHILALLLSDLTMWGGQLDLWTRYGQLCLDESHDP